MKAFLTSLPAIMYKPVSLQLADLMARPVGMSVLKPGQPNRAVDVVITKYLVMNGTTTGWGLKCFA